MKHQYQQIVGIGKVKAKKKSLDKYYFLLILLIITGIGFYVHYFFFFSIHKYSAITSADKNPKYKVLLISSKYSLAEKQETFHNCQAINNLGSDCYIFEFTNSPRYTRFFEFYITNLQKIVNYFIAPDFIFYNCPNMLFEPTNYREYGVLDVGNYESVQMETGLVVDPKGTEWLNRYDGFIVYGDNEKWAQNFVSKLKHIQKDMNMQFLFNYFPSVPSTLYIPSKRLNLFYSGSNWDSRRQSDHYRKIHMLLDEKDYYSVYGRKQNWNFLKNSYKGSISFDATSLVNTINSSGIALLLHTDFHNKHGIPSKRIFEAAAAGAVIISDKNPFVIREFGDCVYYIDPQKEPTEVVMDIDKIVKLVKSNPELANKKAECAHSTFIKKFTLEKQWERVFAMHEKQKRRPK